MQRRLRLTQRELRARSHLVASPFFVETAVRAWPEPGTSSGPRSALAATLEDLRPKADAQLLPSRVDGTIETNCILVSAETRDDHG